MILDSFYVDVKFNVALASLEKANRKLLEIRKLASFKSMIHVSADVSSALRGLSGLRASAMKTITVPIRYSQSSAVPPPPISKPSGNVGLNAEATRIFRDYSERRGASSSILDGERRRSGGRPQSLQRQQGGSAIIPVGGIRRMGAYAAVGAAASSFGGFVKDTVNVAREYEISMIRAAAILKASGSEKMALDKLAKSFVGDGKSDVSIAPREAAAGIKMLAKNNIKYTQIVGGALETSAKLAKVMESKLAPTVDLVTDILVNFKMKAKDLGKAGDIMLGAVNSSKFGFKDMRLSIAQAGGVAGKVGVSFKEFATTLAATSSAFASGSDAGTSFKTFLTTMNPKSKASSVMMDKLGISFFTAKGKMKGMSQIFQMLQDSLGGLSDKAKIAAVSTMFGVDAMRTALSAADAGSAGYLRYQRAIEGASMAEMALAVNDSLDAKINRLSASWERFKLSLVNAGVLTFLKNLFDGLAKAVEHATKLAEAISKAGQIYDMVVGKMQKGVVQVTQSAQARLADPEVQRQVQDERVRLRQSSTEIRYRNERKEWMLKVEEKRDQLSKDNKDRAKSGLKELPIPTRAEMLKKIAPPETTGKQREFLRLRKSMGVSHNVPYGTFESPKKKVPSEPSPLGHKAVSGGNTVINIPSPTNIITPNISVPASPSVSVTSRPMVSIPMPIPARAEKVGLSGSSAVIAKTPTTISKSTSNTVNNIVKQIQLNQRITQTTNATPPSPTAIALQTKKGISEGITTGLAGSLSGGTNGI